jgi:GNAT superfamily N-acetyltransferase
MHAGSPLTIRTFDPARDTAAVLRLDTSVTSDAIFESTIDDEAMRIRPVPASSGFELRFPIDLSEPKWETAYVATVDDAVCGFVAMNYHKWNRRLAIWHFYVDRPWRRRGIGRRLMEQALQVGLQLSALTAWVETSNRNVPGITAYRRLGFSLCGCDRTLYTGTPYENEFAIYLSQPIGNWRMSAS